QIKDTQSSLSVSGELSSSSSVSFVLAQLQQRHKSVQHSPAEKQEHLPVSQAPLQPQSGAGFLVIHVMCTVPSSICQASPAGDEALIFSLRQDLIIAA